MSLRLTLFNKSIVENLEEHNYKNFKLFIKPKKFLLNDEQKKSLLEMKKKGANFNVHVLDGVTGSGKTLVYFSRVKELIDEGFQALIMLPEIGLTSQFQKRFFEYFGFQAAIWHSDVSKKNKKIIWRGILENKIKAVVGARSSLFLPFSKLGIIRRDNCSISKVLICRLFMTANSLDNCNNQAIDINIKKTSVQEFTN